MKIMRTKQEGISFWGLVCVVAFIAIIVLFSLRAFPLYNEKMAVVSAINSVATRPDATTLSTKSLRKYFLRTLQTSSNALTFNDTTVKEYVTVERPSKKGEPKVMRVKYQATNVLFGDLMLMLNFDQKKDIRGPGG